MQRRALFRRALTPLVMAASLACWGSAASAETLTVGGSGNTLETVRKLGLAFARKEPGAALNVLPSIGSGGAVKGLTNRSLDIGAVSRPLKDDEKALGLQTVYCGQTPLVLATNRPSETGITTRQLEDMFAGQQTKWGDGSPIRLVLRPAIEADTQLLATLSPGLKQAIGVALGRPGMIIYTTDQDAADALERQPGSLGTSTLGLIRAEGRQLKLLPLNGINPVLNNKANAAYPLNKPMYIVFRNDAPPAVKRFAQFVQSPEGVAVLEANGFTHAGATH